jgi:putative FmdB family regulatory protein
MPDQVRHDESNSCINAINTRYGKPEFSNTGLTNDERQLTTDIYAMRSNSMPLYEYKCKECGRINTALILKPREEEKLQCGRCRSPDLDRILSRFALHKTEAQRVDEFDPLSQRSDSFYKDDRNVGLWAKKRMKQLGVDLGSGFDETVEKARSGKLPEGELL